MKVLLLCRFLDKLYDFFKPEQKDGFNNVNLSDPLSNVTCRSLMAFADLLIFPDQPTKHHIKVLHSTSDQIVSVFLHSTLPVIQLTHFSLQLVMH